jgi:hypothetical protein
MKIIELDGVSYKLPNAKDIKFQQGLLALLPKVDEVDPVEQVARIAKDLHPDVQIVLLQDAIRQKQTRKSKQEVEEEKLARLSDYVSTSEGLEKFLCLLWQLHQPELTKDQVFALHQKATSKLGDEYLND